MLSVSYQSDEKVTTSPMTAFDKGLKSKLKALKDESDSLTVGGDVHSFFNAKKTHVSRLIRNLLPCLKTPWIKSKSKQKTSTNVTK